MPVRFKMVLLNHSLELKGQYYVKEVTRGCVRITRHLSPKAGQCFVSAQSGLEVY